MADEQEPNNDGLSREEELLAQGLSEDEVMAKLRGEWSAQETQAEAPVETADSPQTEAASPVMGPEFPQSAGWQGRAFWM